MAAASAPSAASKPAAAASKPASRPAPKPAPKPASTTGAGSSATTKKTASSGTTGSTKPATDSKPYETSTERAREEKEGKDEKRTETLEDALLKTYKSDESKESGDSEGKKSTEDPKAEKSEAQKTSGEEAKADKPEDPNDKADAPTLDLSKPLTVKAMQTFLDRVANEGGESGSFNLHVEGSGKVNGVDVGAWGDLGLSISKSDNESAVVLGLNTEIAAKLGFDVGIFKAEVGAGAKFGEKVRFKNSADAAAYLTSNLHKINQSTKSKNNPNGMFQIEGSDFKYNQPTAISEKGGLLQGKAKLELDKMGKLPSFLQGGEASLKVRGETVDQTFKEPNGDVSKGNRTALQVSASGKIPLGDGVAIEASYDFEQSHQVGDPVLDNNGKYRNHKVGVQVDVEALKKMTPKQLRTMVEKMMSVSDGEIALTLKPQVDKAIDAIKGQLGEIEKNPPKHGGYGKIGLQYEANNILENGEYKNQYQRLLFTREGGYKAEADLKLIKGEFNANIKRSERLFQVNGTQTESHLKNVFNASRDPNADRGVWSKFKEQNPETVEKITELHARNNPNSEVARALKAGDKSGALQKLEEAWGKEYSNSKAMDQTARKLADYGNQWVLSGSEETRMLREIESVFKANPKNLIPLFDRMESLGITKDKLMSKTGGYFSTNDEQLQGYYNLYRQLKSIEEYRARKGA